MSIAHSKQTRPDPQDVVAFALAALMRGRSLKKRATLCATIRRAAMDLEYAALRRAGVYPIDGGGRAFGEREADHTALAAAAALHEAVRRVEDRGPRSR